MPRSTGSRALGRRACCPVVGNYALQNRDTTSTTPSDPVSAEPASSGPRGSLALLSSAEDHEDEPPRGTWTKHPFSFGRVFGNDAVDEGWGVRLYFWRTGLGIFFPLGVRYGLLASD